MDCGFARPGKDFHRIAAGKRRIRRQWVSPRLGYTDNRNLPEKANAPLPMRDALVQTVHDGAWHKRNYSSLRRRHQRQGPPLRSGTYERIADARRVPANHKAPSTVCRFPVPTTGLSLGFFTRLQSLFLRGGTNRRGFRAPECVGVR